MNEKENERVKEIKITSLNLKAGNTDEYKGAWLDDIFYLNYIIDKQEEKWQSIGRGR